MYRIVRPHGWTTTDWAIKCNIKYLYDTLSWCSIILMWTRWRTSWTRVAGRHFFNVTKAPRLDDMEPGKYQTATGRIRGLQLTITSYWLIHSTPFQSFDNSDTWRECNNKPMNGAFYSQHSYHWTSLFTSFITASVATNAAAITRPPK